MLDDAFRADVLGTDDVPLIHFTGERFQNEPGFYVRGVQGILDGADPTFESSAGHRTDGIFDVDNERTDPRIIVFTGFIYSASLADLGHRILRLRGLLAGNTDKGVLAWSEFGERMWTVVRRGAGSRVDRRGSTGYADFTIRFRASSQRIYGRLNEVGPASSIHLTHHGNYSAVPKLTVTGASPGGYTISGPDGLQYVVTAPLVSGTPHVIDMATGWLSIGGIVQTEAVGRADIWHVPPGAGVDVSVSGGLNISGETYDEFI